MGAGQASGDVVLRALASDRLDGAVEPTAARHTRSDWETEMLTPRRRLAQLSCLFLSAVATCARLPTPAVATTPFPPTVIRHKDGKWQLQNDYLGGARIFVVGADDETKLLLWIKDAIPKEEYEKYVHDTTAGPQWEDYALSYFVTVDGKPHFCIRTWWDRRIVIDLAAAKHISDRGKEAAFGAAEKNAVLETLKGGVTVVSKPNIPIAAFFRLQAATHLAGRVKEKKAVPLLRRLEPLGFETASALGEYGPGIDLKEGDISPRNYSTHQLRRVVQLSLRRLGETPAALPVTSFQRRGFAKAFEPRRWDGPRSERVAAVKATMKPIDVLNTLGPPDYVESGQNIRREGPWEVAWRYDLDTQLPETILIVWKGQNVMTLEKFSPALWKGNDLTSGDVKPALFDADGSIMNAKVLYSSAFEGKITRLK